MSILKTDYVIDDANASERLQGGFTGLVPRNYNANPVGSYEGSVTFGALNDEIPLIPWEDMPGLIAEKIANKSQLSDIRNSAYGSPIPSLDQNGQGYCWNYSPNSAVLLLRALANMPYVRVSGHAGAWVIKNGRDQGGWGAQGLDRIRSHGTPSIEFWPEKSMDGRRYNTPATWENALLHRVTEGFIDLDAAQYDRTLAKQEYLTCLLRNIPVIGDYNHWRHSVCLMDAVDAFPNKSPRDPSRYGERIWNSWRDSWGQNGTGVLTGSKSGPDGATAPRAVVVSDK